MQAYEIRDQHAGDGRGAGLSRAAVERYGRWKAFRSATMATVLLWAAQLPAYQVARGRWTDHAGLAVLIPARISLMLDLGMILGYLTVAYRAAELVRSARAPRAFRQLASTGMVLVGAGAAADVIEDVMLWFAVGHQDRPVTLHTPITPAMLTAVLTGLGLLTTAAVLSSPGLWWQRTGDAVRARNWWRGTWVPAPGRPVAAVLHRVAQIPVRWIGRVVAPHLDRNLPCAMRRWRETLVANGHPHTRTGRPAAAQQGPGQQGPGQQGPGQPGPGQPVAGPSVAGQPVVGGPPADGKLVICCSGGGIRSASFCLGGLQTLMDQGLYQKADAVIGVSGGGYIAAAYHVARWQSVTEPGGGLWQETPEPPVFAPESAELRWLRRNTRYLFDTPRVALLGMLSLLFGIAVNLILLAAVLGGTAWWLGWLLAASDGIDGWATAQARGGDYAGVWTWLGKTWWLLFAGLAMFVLEKVIDRYVAVPIRWRTVGRNLSYWLIVGGALTIVLFIGLPNLLEALHNYAATHQDEYASLIYMIGLVPDKVCAARLDAQLVACGVAVGGELDTDIVGADTVSGGSLAAVVVAVLGAVRTALSVVSSDKGADKGVRALLGRVWDKLSAVVLPWVAATVICLVAVALLIRWVAALLANPSLLTNWRLLGVFAVLLLIIKVGTDANRTSLHHFYRERLSHAFLVRREGSMIEPVAYRTPLRFSEAEPPLATARGSGGVGRRIGPRLVACAVANVSDPELVPSDRDCTPFVFGHAEIGLTDRLLPAGQATSASGMYEFAADPGYRDATIPAAMAMSGAAVSPLAGRANVRVGPYRLLLALANARLGVWLPNPLWIDDVAVVRQLIKLGSPDAVGGWARLSGTDQRMLYLDLLNDADRRWLYHRAAPPVGGDDYWFDPGPREDARPAAWRFRLAAFARMVLHKPGPFWLAKEAIGKASYIDRLLYVTDGGHYDNLGLVEALRQQPDEVIVLDASSDPEDSFQALGQAIATARMDLDCEVDFDPREMRKLEKARSTAAWGRGTVRYRDGGTGTILLAKVILVEGLPWDLETYQANHPQFPRTSTGNQLYGEFDLEAYRILGREVTKRLIDNPPAGPNGGS